MVHTSRRLQQLRKRLQKKVKKGFRGYPVGTVAFYGPDDQRATKLVAGIVRWENDESGEMRTWTTEEGDVRNDGKVGEEVVEFFSRHNVLSTVMPDRIIGCIHQEGIDYDGPVCPHCPFWANRDRWTGEIIH